MKTRILYYSDCPFFGGCENMLANFLNDKDISREFSISFAYNYSREYERGLNNRVQTQSYCKYPLKLLKQLPYKKPAGTLWIWLLLHKAIFALILPVFKYFSILINTIILIFFFKRHKADILHINNGGFPAAYSCYSAVIAARITGIRKIIYVVNNIAEDYKHPFRWLDYPIDILIKNWVTVFITSSKNAGLRLKQVLRLEEKQYLMINNGIQRRPVTLSSEEFKNKYSIPASKVLGSVVANLEERKGHIFLLEAIMKLKKQQPDVFNFFFVFEGKGPEKSTLENYIIQYDLSDCVLLIEYIPDIFNLLNASDFIILPSIANEDFPNVIIEAMSLGKPVIGTDIAGIPEQVENNISGLVVSPRNSEELLHALIKIVTEPLTLSKFSVEALKRFNTLYEKSISINKYINLYKSLN